MIMNLNKCMFMGNLGRDAEVRQAGESKVASFSLAVSEKYKDTEKTEWVNCVAWGKLADIAEKYFKKGTKLYVEGKVQTRSWDGENGKQYRTEFVIFSFQFTGGPKQEGDAPKSEPAPTLPKMEDDLPF